MPSSWSGSSRVYSVSARLSMLFFVYFPDSLTWTLRNRAKIAYFCTSQEIKIGAILVLFELRQVTYDWLTSFCNTLHDWSCVGALVRMS